ncbi:hypothetical protein [Roseateles sp.]
MSVVHSVKGKTRYQPAPSLRAEDWSCGALIALPPPATHFGDATPAAL